MLSLYVHIPFCRHKCAYCSFFVLPEADIAEEKQEKLETIKDLYLQHLLGENTSWRKKFGDQQIKTIYIGGGTPFQIGETRLFTLIDTLLETRNTEFLEELSIELNPDPMDEVLNFIDKANRKYSKIFKLRYSIGIQSFDDKILEKSGRGYYFNNLVRFFRDLQKLKQTHVSYNFDFIAFGKGENNSKQDLGRTGDISYTLRNDMKRDFFEKLVNSHVADGYSIYTLELFPGSERYNEQKSGIRNQNLEARAESGEEKRTKKLQDLKNSGDISGLVHSNKKIHPLQGDDESIFEEFNALREIVEKAGYQRYEISNFSLRGKRSLHNMVYREMGNYLGLGVNSSSYLSEEIGRKVLFLKEIGREKNKNIIGYRFSNTRHRKSYLKGEYLDKNSLHPLHEQEWRIEKAFLALRTDIGLKNVREEWSDVFVKDRETLLSLREKEGIVYWNREKDVLKLTRKGMDLYNSVITDVFAKI